MLSPIGLNPGQQSRNRARSQDAAAITSAFLVRCPSLRFEDRLGVRRVSGMGFGGPQPKKLTPKYVKLMPKEYINKEMS